MRKEKNPDGLHTKCKQIKIKILKEKQRKTKEIGKARGTEVIFF